MSEAARRILSYLRDDTAEMLETLKGLVELDSPSSDKASLDRFSARLAELFLAAGVGATVDTLVQEKAGNHLLVRVPGTAPGEEPILVLGHMDTVWDVGEARRRPVRVEDGKAYGPGIEDMKGGLVQALYALKALAATGSGPRRPVTILCNSDEETGSDTSRPVIEAEALRSAAVLVLEPPNPDGSLKTWRKGVGSFTVRALGRAAHAGADPEKGISAVHELAHQILALVAMNDPAGGTTVNPGVIKGGTRSNVIPAEADVEVDVRVMSRSEGERITAAIKGLRPKLAGASLEITGGIDRPPMERSAANLALYQKARALAAELGLVLTEGGTGGASDGNFTAALGRPTLDGLGAWGDGGHALSEYVIIESLPQRAALLAGILRSL